MAEDELDLALELSRDLNLAAQNDAQKDKAVWEHEDLAQVRMRVLREHSKGVNSCQFFNDGTKFVTASDDKSVKLWSFQSGGVLQSLDNIHDMAVNEARISSDGKCFVSCGWDKKVKFWDTEKVAEKWSGKHGGVVTCCKLSHDEKMVCSGSDMDNILKIWDTRSGEIIHNLKDHHSSTITSCIFAPKDDKVITTSMDRVTKFFDLRTCTTTIQLEGHFNIVSCCAISKDERKFATTSWDKTVQQWDIATGMYRSKGSVCLKGQHEGSVSCCNFSKDGLMLVTGSYDHSVVVWDTDNHVQKIKLQGHTDWINDVCFSEDQKWLISCSKDETVRLWNVEDTDKIPVVLENRKSIGLKVIKCSTCSKPFSIAQLDNFRDLTLCVFCRLQDPGKTWLEIHEPVA
ncbi:WD repeat-containing protein 88-like [Haliotis rufescens]|uniref:WD repeat-containing protein 88-like n=1 Tax=Haliotis rufescens TaxID=6454 RepID=UPI001EB024EF|nr:WD repeat-containing protein 88-like [Haliotis rufescens]